MRRRRLTKFDFVQSSDERRQSCIRLVEKGGVLYADGRLIPHVESLSDTPEGRAKLREALGPVVENMMRRVERDILDEHGPAA